MNIPQPMLKGVIFLNFYGRIHVLKTIKLRHQTKKTPLGSTCYVQKCMKDKVAL